MVAAISQLLTARKKLWTPETDTRGYAQEHPRLKDALSIVSPNPGRLAVDESSMSASFVISTMQPDRMGDVVVPEGVYLENYKKNPIVFFGHQVPTFIGQLAPLPIGKAEDPSGQLTIIVRPQQDIIGTVYFSQKLLLAQQVFELVVEDILRATSIGFNPLGDPVHLGDDEPHPLSPWPGCKFERWELLEFSIVGIPCNPGAVRSILSRNKLAGDAIDPMIRKSLEPLAAAPKAWAPGFTVNKQESQTMTKTIPADALKKLLAMVPPNQQAAAIALTPTFKDLSESDGSDGGYAVGEDEDEDATHKRIKEAIFTVAESYKEDGEGDQYFYHPIKFMAYHQHGDSAEEGHLKAVKEDLGKIDGIKEVGQGPSKPDGDGHQQVHPKPGSDGEGDGGKRGKPAKKKDGLDGLDDGTPPPDTGEPMPHGAQCAQRIIELLEEEVAESEPEVQEFFQQMLDTVLEWAEDRYPDVDFGGKDETDGDGDDGMEMEDEETQEIVDAYRSGKISRAKLLAAIIQKRMSKRHKAVCKEAMEHLGDMAELEAGSTFTRTHKAACKAHHGAMKAILREDGDDDDQDDDDGKTATPAKGGAGTALVDALKQLNANLDQAGERRSKVFYKLTGQKN
jgi:hypothetical protein